ncbi:MAG TPA: IclR family transcriptional regulator, partial [Cupriavidus sp.]|nr:IclR family transcriptional regulator [Cupriavidus sp.]
RSSDLALERSGLRPLTTQTVVDIDTLMGQIARGHKRGWYDAREEGSEGVYGLAVVGLLGGQPAGISVAGPAERMKKNHDAYLAALTEVRDALMEAA